MPTIENASHFLMTHPHQSTCSSLHWQHHRASKTGKNNATTHATLGLLRGSLSAHHPRWNDHLKFTPKPFVAALSPLSNRKKQAIIRNSNHPQNNSPSTSRRDTFSLSERWSVDDACTLPANISPSSRTLAPPSRRRSPSLARRRLPWISAATRSRTQGTTPPWTR